MLPHERAGGGEHQHDGVFGDRDGVGAAVVGDGHAGLVGGRDVAAVVAGGEELDELEVGGGGVEGIVHARVAEADEVVAAGHGGVELGREGGGFHQLKARGGHVGGDFCIHLAVWHEDDALHSVSSGSRAEFSGVGGDGQGGIIF